MEFDRTLNNTETSDLQADLNWLNCIIKYQLGLADEELKHNIENNGEILPPKLSNATLYGNFISNMGFSNLERGILIIALAIYFKPVVFDDLLKFAKDNQFSDTRFGGIIGSSQSSFIPTGETIVFLLTNGSLVERLEIMRVLSHENRLFSDGILDIKYSENKNLNLISFAVIELTNDYKNLFLFGKIDKPNYSVQFPASLISTNSEWSDLVVSETLHAEISDIEKWIKHESYIKSHPILGKKIKRGYKVIFYGPPGTGKSMVAGLIGKKFDIDVYRIDVSQLSSKYIGETEKNIENLFKQAKNKNWILFFDEGETLFSKRANSGQGNEKYSNQQIGFLLQKIEDYEGLVILATNLKGSIDDAFFRRFQKMIYFEPPDFESRLILWNKAIDDVLILSSDINLKRISKEYEVVGGQIINVVKQLLIKQLSSSSGHVSEKIFIDCLVSELRKK